MIVVMRCADGKAAVPSTVVTCSVCNYDCWLSKKTGTATIMAARETGDTRFVCMQCMKVLLQISKEPNGE